MAKMDVGIDTKDLEATLKRFEDRLDKVLNKSGILGNVNLEATLKAYQIQAENSAKLHHERLERIALEQTSWEKKHQMRAAERRHRQMGEMIMRTMSGGGVGALIGGAEIGGAGALGLGKRIGGAMKSRLGATATGKGLRFAMGDEGAIDKSAVTDDPKGRDRSNKVAKALERPLGRAFTKALKAANKAGQGLQKHSAGIGA